MAAVGVQARYCGGQLPNSTFPTWLDFAGMSARATLLLPFQRDIPDPDVRPQFVFAVAVILESLAQPAAGFAVAVAVHVANAGAGPHQMIGCAFRGDPNVAHAQLQVFIAFDVFDP